MVVELGRPEGLRTAAGLVDCEVPIDFIDAAPQGVGEIENMDIRVVAVVGIEAQNSQRLEPRFRISELCEVLRRAFKQPNNWSGTGHYCVDVLLYEG